MKLDLEKVSEAIDYVLCNNGSVITGSGFYMHSTYDQTYNGYAFEIATALKKLLSPRAAEYWDDNIEVTWGWLRFLPLAHNSPRSVGAVEYSAFYGPGDMDLVVVVDNDLDHGVIIEWRLCGQGLCREQWPHTRSQFRKLCDVLKIKYDKE